MLKLITIGFVTSVLYSAASDNEGAALMTKHATGQSQHASVLAYPDAIVTATDPASRITISVDTDGRSVSARSSDGAVLWRVDVLKETGKPSEGFPVVRRIEFTKQGKVLLIIGKHRAVEADLKSGEMKVFGEN